jgi:HD-GYP domain-containing protein (c-di-GMP phosphodiesterase class II)
MHDIGKVGIPDSILLKPGPLTPEERRLMEQHPLIGADTLVAIRQRVGDDDLLNMGIQVTLSHHERFDGKGYPYRISSDQIPLSARIVALADMYDALTSDRVYKKAMSHAQATTIIRENRGSHFDPAIVDAYMRLERQFDQTHLALKPDAGQRPALVEIAEQALRAAA